MGLREKAIKAVHEGMLNGWDIAATVLVDRGRPYCWTPDPKYTAKNLGYRLRGVEGYTTDHKTIQTEAGLELYIQCISDDLDFSYWEGISVQDPEPDETELRLIKTEQDRDRARDEASSLRRRLTIAQREADSLEVVRSTLLKISAQPSNPPDWPVEFSTSSGFSGVPMTLWSDWHFGEVIRSAEVAGVNEFNTEIAIRRVRELVAKVIDLCKNHMTNPTYPGIVCALGGDMISGDIHPELQDTNDQYTFQTILLLRDLLIWAIRELKKAFGRVFVPCAVGNHGRDTFKPRMKGRVHTSFEWLLYSLLEREFADDPDVTVMNPGESDSYFKVYDHRFLLTHGDSLGVKGGDGIIGSMGPIMRGAVKVGRSEAQVGRDFDTILMGHWHQYLTLPGVIVNGTLKGYDEYARLALRAPYQRPTQALWFVHPRHGITAQWPIYLEPKRSFDQSVNWIEWPSTEGILASS